MKKIPLRKCIVSQTQHPKKDLIRVVLTPEDLVVIDETGRMNGRGAYVLRDLETIAQAKKSRAIDRALKTKVDDSIYQELVNYVS